MTSLRKNIIGRDFHYIGNGEATLSAYGITLRGETAVEVTAMGKFTITMTIASAGCPDFDLLREIVIADADCDRLLVVSDVGSITASDSVRLTSAGIHGTRHVVKFSAGHLVYDAKSDSPVRYWSVPLHNFVPDYFYHGEVPPAILRVGNGDQAIRFKCDNEDVFIEPVHNYFKKLDRLRSHKTAKAVTAVMTGTANDNMASQAYCHKKLQYTLLPTLSLLCGTEVGASWVDFRDEHGEVVRRIFGNWRGRRYTEGHDIGVGIPEKAYTEILECAQTSKHSGTLSFRVALMRTVRGCDSNISLEDEFSHLFRALDNLCEYFGTKSCPPLTDRQIAKEIDDTLNQFCARFESVANSIGNVDEEGDAFVVNKIIANIKRASDVQKGYGDGVAKLLDMHGVNDLSVMREYHKEHPRRDKKKWVGALSYTRGVVMHRGYFDFEADEKGHFDDAGVLNTHLYDLLVRIILKMIGYSKLYNSPIGGRRRTVDWVTPDTHGSELGYHFVSILTGAYLRETVANYGDANGSA